jgi:hypothetical protein
MIKYLVSYYSPRTKQTTAKIINSLEDAERFICKQLETNPKGNIEVEYLYYEQGKTKYKYKYNGVDLIARN